MKKGDDLVARFQEKRKHLQTVACQILGSSSDADDAIQETWLRLTRADADQIENLDAWLTTVLARVCLDSLRSSRVRKEEFGPNGPHSTDAISKNDPERDLLFADSVGLALTTVVEALTPSERVAFVLHDSFDLSFEEIARILDRSPASVRQLASRARRKVQGATPLVEADPSQQRMLVNAFMTASREGNLSALLALLDPNVQLRADDAAIRVAKSSPGRDIPPFERQIVGAENVAELFKGRMRNAKLALIDGAAGTTWIFGGKPVSVLSFFVKDGKIAEFEIVMSPGPIQEMKVEPL